jgi:hypothetical protein
MQGMGEEKVSDDISMPTRVNIRRETAFPCRSNRFVNGVQIATIHLFLLL